eukprot:CAMPEP_0119427356 /NCGR_PEP_ID=MMETSP1335-20130426/38128_1 /TAXON_ID=259385 /ORGANISM="Chrysoculter rhomboideus, Strain RCC1486" /LENGTH=242 /DNA_ID=CAMNT_0007452985 /DNA_START=1 /DNA_END=726 /DNA_ORIENTATION=-
MGVAGCVYLAFGLGIPAVLAALLRTNRSRIARSSAATTESSSARCSSTSVTTQTQSSSGAPSSDDQWNREFVTTFGFLFRGFERTGASFYWEVVVVMPRKVALLTVHTLLNHAPVIVQTLSALFILFVIIVVHTRYQPYMNPSLDRIESLSLVSSFSTLYFGLFLLINDTQLGALPWLSMTVTVLIIAMQAAMILVFVYALLRIVVPQQLAKAASRVEAMRPSSPTRLRRADSPAAAPRRRW